MWTPSAGASRRLALEPELEAIALTSLVEAADRVDSTVGVQMAYLKQWATRANNPLRLRLPELLDGEGSASCLDAAEAAGKYEADVAYLDPPYNQHSYLGNYHVWETLVRWDAPEVYGIACKRIDVRERPSAFNRRGLHRRRVRRRARARARAAHRRVVQRRGLPGRYRGCANCWPRAAR